MRVNKAEKSRLLALFNDLGIKAVENIDWKGVFSTVLQKFEEAVEYDPERKDVYTLKSFKRLVTEQGRVEHVDSNNEHAEIPKKRAYLPRTKIRVDKQQASGAADNPPEDPCLQERTRLLSYSSQLISDVDRVLSIVETAGVIGKAEQEEFSATLGDLMALTAHNLQGVVRGVLSAECRRLAVELESRREKLASYYPLHTASINYRNYHTYKSISESTSVAPTLDLNSACEAASRSKVKGGSGHSVVAHQEEGQQEGTLSPPPKKTRSSRYNVHVPQYGGGRSRLQQRVKAGNDQLCRIMARTCTQQDLIGSSSSSNGSSSSSGSGGGGGEQLSPNTSNTESDVNPSQAPGGSIDQAVLRQEIDTAFDVLCSKMKLQRSLDPTAYANTPFQTSGFSFIGKYPGGYDLVASRNISASALQYPVRMLQAMFSDDSACNVSSFLLSSSQEASASTNNNANDALAGSKKGRNIMVTVPVRAGGRGDGDVGSWAESFGNGEEEDTTAGDTTVLQQQYLVNVNAQELSLGWSSTARKGITAPVAAGESDSDDTVLSGDEDERSEMMSEYSSG